MKARSILYLPAIRRESHERLSVSRPWFNPTAVDPLRPTRPLLLTLTDTDFVERFFEGLRAHMKNPENKEFWEELHEYRDYAEPPNAMLDLAGNPLYPIGPGGIEALPVDQRTDGQRPGLKNGEAPWLRKLYLPFHRHFHIVSCEVLCHRPTQTPPVDPDRILESGYIVRRLVQDPSQVRWEDWIASSDGNGVWTHIADEKMRMVRGDAESSGTTDPRSARLEKKVLNPNNVPLIDWEPDADDPLVKFAFAEGTTSLKLAPQRLNPLPANLGEEVLRHSTRWGYLQLASDAKQLNLAFLSEEDLDELRTFLAKDARENLEPVLLQNVEGLAERIETPLQQLLNRHMLPPVDTDFPAPADYEALVEYPREEDFWLFPISIDSEWDNEIKRREEIKTLVLDGVDGVLERLWGVAGDPEEELVGPENLSNEVAIRWDENIDRVFDAILAPLSSWPRDSLNSNKDAFQRLVLRAVYFHSYPLENNAGLSEGLQEDDGAKRKSRTNVLMAALLRRVRARRIRLLASVLNLVWKNTPRDQTIDQWADEISPDNPQPGDPLIAGVGHLSDEIDAWFALETDRLATFPLWPNVNSVLTGDPRNMGRLDDHRLAKELEEVFEEVDRLGAAGGWAYGERLRQIQAAGITSALTADQLSKAGIDPGAQPERGLLLFPGPAPTMEGLDLFISEVAGLYQSAGKIPVRRYARERRQLIRPRFDSGSIYATWCYARIKGRDPCEKERLVWSGRSDVFTLADPMDVLGMPPMQIQMPSIPKLLRDIPRIHKARANPYIQINFPPRSGVLTGDEFKDTRRDYGLQEVCAYLWPPFTIVAWILFYIVYSILVTIPGFTWMTVIRICMPLPK